MGIGQPMQLHHAKPKSQIKNPLLSSDSNKKKNALVCWHHTSVNESRNRSSLSDASATNSSLAEEASNDRFFSWTKVIRGQSHHSIHDRITLTSGKAATSTG